ncbi:NUDIX hydrolase [Ornithinimicrobium cryptoxanthini]|uniref:CoA pyrophosphatase n=1 Tax=Ornithinimicrobium cryptoxanthini TaxID=2934161 RepID=A0ABY4YDE6_9MICO|nr:CoA pyrophosphatase [Ornithinimicrobium cryptoxanthini]USQ74767.1 CoA pyrophosphatase [Ornithinimicrobium cryptoxanthini]
MTHHKQDASVIPPPIRYDVALRERFVANLAGHQRRVVDLAGRRHAAVALVLVDSTPDSAIVWARHEDGRSARDARLPHEGLLAAAGGAAFLLCRRPLAMRRHAGQYALPGGRLEPGEGAVEAALRETHEEVGADLGPDRVLGLLDDYETRSGFVMTPVVVWGGGVDLRPDPGEVMAVFRVGLHQLQRSDSPRFESIPESDRPVVSVPLGSTEVHAPTAAVLVQLNWLGLLGRSDPVHDFDQPVFAWR